MARMYIARDSNGDTYLYQKKPTWRLEGSLWEFGNNFPYQLLEQQGGDNILSSMRLLPERGEAFEVEIQILSKGRLRTIPAKEEVVWEQEPCNGGAV